MGRRRCLGENFGKAILFVFVANILANFEIILDTSSETSPIKTKEVLLENKKSRDTDEEDYDLEQIHDLGFTLSPKPFNLLLRRRHC